MNIPKNLKYSKDHEWVRIDNSTAFIGITEHAAESLGDITFIELPTKDKLVKQSETISTIESVKAASDIYVPIGGKINSINTALENNPEIINSSPYEDGWICSISDFDKSELKNLMSPEEYETFLNKQ